MGRINQYILSLICSALLLAVIKAIPFKSPQIKSSIQLISGIVMALAVLSPLLKLSIPNLDQINEYLYADAAAIIAEGEEQSHQAEKKIITEQLHKYILNKADSLDADITVEIHLSTKEPYVPMMITIRGNLSPYAQSIMISYLEEELGIGREDQRWILGSIKEK